MDYSEVLTQPTTLKVFLYLKTSDIDEFGIRQTQYDLGFKSPNSVTWHFNKLLDAGLLKKTPQNTYFLTNEAKLINEFEIPYKVTVKLAGSYLLPKFAFLLSFLISAIITALIIFIFVRDPLYLAFTGITLALINLIVIAYQFSVYHKQIQNFDDLD